MKEAIGSLEKAFQIIEIVCREKEFTSKKLAEKLGCDQRTARRYIQKMRYIFEDYIEEVKKGIYRWKGITELDDKILDSPNVRLLYAFLELAKKVGSDKSFWENVKKVFYVKCEDSLNQIIFQNTINYESIKDIKIKIEEAIKKGKAIKFRYTKYNKFYIIEPLKIILYQGFWYVVGIDQKDEKLKTLALDFFEDVEILEDEAFEKTKKVGSVSKLLEEINSIFQIGSDDNFDEVIIELSPEVADFFRRKDILYRQEIIEDKDNTVKIKFFAKNVYDFKLSLFNWIPFFKVISPERYKKFYLKMLNNALEYQNLPF